MGRDDYQMQILAMTKRRDTSETEQGVSISLVNDIRVITGQSCNPSSFPVISVSKGVCDVSCHSVCSSLYVPSR